MSTQENGISDNIRTNLLFPVVIQSSTFTNPIVITTVSPHGLTNGDLVNIFDHTVNWAANVIARVTVLSSTTFSIPISGNGVGGNTGAVQSLALGPTFAIPSDGVDNENASSVGVPFDALADRTAFLAQATGAYKLAKVNFSNFRTDPTPFTNWATITPTAGSWVAVGPPASWTNVLPAAHSGDIYEFHFTGSVALAGGGGNGYGLSLYSEEVVPGFTAVGTRIPGSAQYFYQSGSTTTQVGFHLIGFYNSGFSAGGDVGVMLGMWGTTATAMDLVGDYQLIGKLWRPTSMFQ